MSAESERSDLQMLSLITQTVGLLTAICVSKFIKGKRREEDIFWTGQILLPYLETGYLETNKQVNKQTLELDILFLSLTKKDPNKQVWKFFSPVQQYLFFKIRPFCLVVCLGVFS